MQECRVVGRRLPAKAAAFARMAPASADRAERVVGPCSAIRTAGARGKKKHARRCGRAVKILRMLAAAHAAMFADTGGGLIFGRGNGAMSCVAALARCARVRFRMHAENDRAVSMPARSRRRRVVRLVKWALAAAVVLLLLTPCLMWPFQPIRQSAVRARVHGEIDSIGRAALQYQRDTDSAPTLDGVLNSGMLAGVPLDKFSRVVPVLAGDTGLPLVVQTVPCRAVRKGEMWGGIEERIEHDLPACRFVLMPDWTVVEMQEPDYQRTIAPRVTLKPLR
jgi:hypothetical protein